MERCKKRNDYFIIHGCNLNIRAIYFKYLFELTMLMKYRFLLKIELLLNM